jgi:hypothetical protein
MYSALRRANVIFACNLVPFGTRFNLISSTPLRQVARSTLGRGTGRARAPAAGVATKVGLGIAALPTSTIASSPAARKAAAASKCPLRVAESSRWTAWIALSSGL